MISREKAAEYAKLLKAVADGKEVEEKYVGPGVFGTAFDWEPWDGVFPDPLMQKFWQYRIKGAGKREARTYYIHKCDADMHYKRSVGVRTGYPAEDLVIVREVLPENAE